MTPARVIVTCTTKGTCLDGFFVHGDLTDFPCRIVYDLREGEEYLDVVIEGTDQSTVNTEELLRFLHEYGAIVDPEDWEIESVDDLFEEDGTNPRCVVVFAHV
ncbi:MAG: hypothetical protein KBC26_00655 [Candidatus Pacebacteria bacterium]|nr:hypothetical protein [Candidatus Paceibacterota bacterium]